MQFLHYFRPRKKKCLKMIKYNEILQFSVDNYLSTKKVKHHFYGIYKPVYHQDHRWMIYLTKNISNFRVQPSSPSSSIMNDIIIKEPRPPVDGDRFIILAFFYNFTLKIMNSVPLHFRKKKYFVIYHFKILILDFTQITAKY